MSNALKHLAALSFCVSFAACGTDAPDDVLLSYMRASLQGEFESAYSMVSAADRSTRSLDEYRSREGGDAGVRGALEPYVEYSVQSVEVSGDSASVGLEVTMPDLGGMALSLFGLAFTGDTAAMRSAMGDRLENGELPTTTSTESFTLVREEGVWRVSLGWRATDLRAEAEELREEGDISRALELYQEAAELDPGSAEIGTAVDELVAELEAERKLEEYRSEFLALENVRVTQERRYSFSEPEPGIRGRIINRGDRMVNMVKVVVYFLNSDGVRIGETTYTPVLVSGLSFGDNTPLRPNYEHDFGYYVSDVAPQNWSGEVEAEIGEIRLDGLEL